MNTIDLNADLGEGVGDDEAMLALVTSANIACGAHAGDPTTMARLCEVARTRGVRIGAHVSYLDREGFGRRRLDVEPELLSRQLAEQIQLLQAIAGTVGAEVNFVKPHGALYNVAADDPVTAAAIMSAVRSAGPHLAVMALAGSEMVTSARAAGLAVIPEAFADRAYQPDARLVDRAVTGAVHNEAVAVTQALAIAERRPIAAGNGSMLSLDADSLCVHGDTPGAVALTTRLVATLRAAGVELHCGTPRP